MTSADLPRGPRRNNSQWFVTFAPCEHLDGKHTLFGSLLPIRFNTFFRRAEDLDTLGAIFRMFNSKPSTTPRKTRGDTPIPEH